MSSSNLVRLAYMREAEYGKRPDVDNTITMNTARFTDESLSGTPETTESAELRVDRMSGGQVVTGLTVDGDINFELARDPFFDDFFEAAMLETWEPASSQVGETITLTPNGSDPQMATLTIVDGDFTAFGDQARPLGPGSVLTFTPDHGNRVVVTIISITDAKNAEVVTARDEPAVTAEVKNLINPAYLDIGSTVISHLISKEYTDVPHDVTTDNHSQTYTGEMVSGFNVNATYGEIVTGTFSNMGNGYLQEYPSFAQLVTAAGGAINPAGTTLQLNASLDVPVVTVDGFATEFCIQRLAVSLDNGLTADTCLGKAAPTGYTLGTAAVNVELDVYLSDTSYDAFMPAKLTQSPVGMTIVMENEDGGYGFQFAALQLSFPDPAATGQNEQVLINAAGTGKVGENGESAIRIHRF